MIGNIRCEYDRESDIHIAYVKWFIETEEDCRIWHKQLEDYLSKFPNKVDIIYVCDDLKLGPKIGPVWGTHRAS